MKKIDYLNDEMAKNLFKFKPILVDFLNSVFSYSKTPLTSTINYEDRELTPKFFKGKKSFVDLYVRNQDGEDINIEIQKRKLKDFCKRAIRYLVRLSDNMEKGQKDEDMTRTVCLSIINFYPDEIKFDKDFHYSNSLRSDASPHEKFSELLEMHFINIVHWRKLNPNILNKIESMSRLEKWTAYLCSSLTKIER